MSDSDDPVSLPNEEEGADLFGDEGDEAQSDHGRVLSDHDLASDQDEGERHAHDDDDMDDNQEVKVKRIMGVTVHRHRTPRTKDSTLQSMRVPYFLKWQAEEYKPDSFEPTEWDMENARSDKSKNVIRFQRDSDTGELKSNALVYRWSDGSLTMSVGADHYEIQKKGMAPPPNKPYEEREDAHYYVAAAHFTSELFMTVGHVSDQYTVNLSSRQQDEATIKFNQAMAAAARGRNNAENMIIATTRDPELQKKEAELAEKEQLRAQRRRENAAARLDARGAGYRSGGLSINDLEGGRRATGGSRKRGAPGSGKARRRRPEYDSDDDLPSGSRRQDEYDREDDFIAPSDDDNLSGGDDEEEEDILDDDEDEEEAPPRRKRQKTAEADDDADADADADLDDMDAPAPAAESSRARRRHVVDDDDED